MTQLYRKQSYSSAKWDAQANLEGRTHYADDETLRFFHARIISTHVTDGGLLFALVESVALDPRNTSRGFRYVIFDIFGQVLSRNDLEHTFKTSDKAREAMWDELNTINAAKVTREGMKREREGMKRDHAYMRDTLRELKQSGKV